MTQCYRRYMKFDIAFVSWVKILLDLLKLSNFLSLDPVFPTRKNHMFFISNNENYWVWRKFFERFITILNVWADIIRVLFFQLVSIIRNLDSKFRSFFTEELKILNNNLIQYLYLFILIYPLEFAKRLVT